jgi:hypothetical protein
MWFSLSLVSLYSYRTPGLALIAAFELNGTGLSADASAFVQTSVTNVEMSWKNLLSWVGKPLSGRGKEAGPD